MVPERTRSGRSVWALATACVLSLLLAAVGCRSTAPVRRTPAPSPGKAPSPAFDSVLYVIVGDTPCHCLDKINSELTQLSRQVVERHDNRVRMEVLNSSADRDKFAPFYDLRHPSAIPVLLLIVRDEDEDDVVFEADYIRETFKVTEELESWVESLSAE